MVLFFIIISVSIDAYAAGLAYNLARKMSLGEALYAGSFTFFACVIAMLLRKNISRYESLLDIVGALILIFIGFKYIADYFFGEKKSNAKIGITMLGLSVSADAAIAAATMTDIGIIECSLLMFLCHTMFLYLSVVTVKPLKVFKELKLFAGVFLAFLGINKIIAPIYLLQCGEFIYGKF